MNDALRKVLGATGAAPQKSTAMVQSAVGTIELTDRKCSVVAPLQTGKFVEFEHAAGPRLVILLLELDNAAALQQASKHRRWFSLCLLCLALQNKA